MKRRALFPNVRCFLHSLTDFLCPENAALQFSLCIFDFQNPFFYFVLPDKGTDSSDLDLPDNCINGKVFLRTCDTYSLNKIGRFPRFF